MNLCSYIQGEHINIAFFYWLVRWQDLNEIRTFYSGLTSSHESLSYVFHLEFVAEVERLAVVVELQHVLQVLYNHEAETREQR